MNCIQIDPSVEPIFNQLTASHVGLFVLILLLILIQIFVKISNNKFGHIAIFLENLLESRMFDFSLFYFIAY